MVCPKYLRKEQCGFHSEFYKLTKETIRDYCKKEYQTCEEYLKNKKALEILSQNK